MNENDREHLELAVYISDCFFYDIEQYENYLWMERVVKQGTLTEDDLLDIIGCVDHVSKVREMRRLSKENYRNLSAKAYTKATAQTIAMCKKHGFDRKPEEETK